MKTKLENDGRRLAGDAEPKRKIVQITMSPETKAGFGAVVVLCDDGSLWSALLDGTKLRNWARQQLPDSSFIQ